MTSHLWAVSRGQGSAPDTQCSTYEYGTTFTFRALLLVSGQPVGSLQAVKESLLRMRRQHDRLSAASSTSLTANAGSGVPVESSVQTTLAHSSQQTDSTIAYIANELIRYMLDDEALKTSLLVANDNMASSGTETAPSSDPSVVSIALQHQQLRAEVMTLTQCFCY